ncbi:flagellar export chaperone FliS [Salipaludibacillus keqinensis]|uniref:Flagellar secretion chaperone FliS n=1 Tax=Salipaludibacillus keqinensis TaxID=2045207 RepID=A0A323THZ0_9BACI|nr:flagellar export chaperone FliS [Salipaludibacillus keqinensis]PYZ94389.1 flagellar export chaperone FliS [Salipaludibacillus keqinensis]
MISNEALHKKTAQEITALLYEACLDHLEEAKMAINELNHTVANEKLQKSSDILYRLGAGLNYEAGIVADQLDSLYNYLADRIVQANYKKDPAIIDEVVNHISIIYAAWSDAMKKNVDQEQKMLKLKKNAYEKNQMFEH